jgi:hypothetical protein
VGAAPATPKVLHRRTNGTRAGASFPPATGWACEIVWSATLFGAGFHAKAAAPGQQAFVIARSPKVDHPPLVPPKPDPDLMAAARTLVRALRDAGWQPVSRGDRWYAQRFVWAGEQDPQPLP